MLYRRTLSVFLFAILSAFPAFAQFPNGITARILFPPRNFEMPLGDTIIPRARIINTSSHADSGIIIRYIIRNVVNNIALYYRLDSIAILAPGDSIDLTFPPYPTNPNIIAGLGTFRGCLVTIDSGIYDTTYGLIFAIRRTSVPFFDPSDNYGKTLQGDIPDQTMWCSIGATVVDGEDSTWNPPPPRYPNGGVGTDHMISPVIRLDRMNFDGNYYAGAGMGDTLTSFPINLQAKTQVILSFDYMRGGRHDYPLGSDIPTLNGPLPTVLDSNGKVLPGDSLILEFRKPLASVYNPSDSGWNEIAAIDGGHDFEFKTARISRNYDERVWNIQVDGGNTILLPDTTDYFTPDFRFRLRLKSNNIIGSYPVEDAAAWYVDNLQLTTPLLPEGEVSWVKVTTPCTEVPRSQAVFPVFFNFFNISYPINISQPFFVYILAPNEDTVYSDTVQVNNIREGQDTIIPCKDWDARNLIGTDGTYTVIEPIDNGWFLLNSILTTYSKLYLRISDDSIPEFAMDNAGLDPTLNIGNDIPKVIGKEGKGIGFENTTGSFALKFQLEWPDTFYGARAYFGTANQGFDSIEFSIYASDSNAIVPGQRIAGSILSTHRGPQFDQFSSYFEPAPILLQPGIYWLAVSQLYTQSMELGGNIFRGGAQAIQQNRTSPRIQAMYNDALYGTEWGSDPSDNNGNVTGMFAYETPAGSGNWKSMTPDSGWWPAMDSSSHLTPIIVPNVDSIRWRGLGTYFPDIRPMFAPYSPPSSVKSRNNAPDLTLSIYPNPFIPNSHSMRISFSDGTEEPATLMIRNVLGNLLKRIVLLPDQHSILWDGKYENGETVPAGIYFLELTAGAEHATEKIIVQ